MTSSSPPGIDQLIDDFTPENGATWMVPGATSGVAPPTRSGSTTTASSWKIRRGDIVVCHGATWHASGANRTERGRMILWGSSAALLRNRSRTDSGWRSPKSSRAPDKRLSGFGSQSGLRT